MTAAAKPKVAEELPWWTEEELQGIAAIDDLILATKDYDVPVARICLYISLEQG